MKKASLMIALAISFFMLFPLALRLSDPLFTHAYERSSFDPVLLVCPDHLEILQLHEAGDSKGWANETGCTFQVAPSNPAHIEKSIHGVLSPTPRKSGWVVHVKQAHDGRQRIDLFLLGDGVAGMIYDVQDEQITPLRTRLTGPLSSLIVLVCNFILWSAAWFVAWCSFLVYRKTQARIEQRRACPCLPA